MGLDSIVIRLKEQDHILSLIALINFVLTPTYIDLLGIQGNIIVFINFFFLVISGLLICVKDRKKDIFYIIISSFLLISILVEFSFSSSNIFQITRIVLGLSFFTLMCFRIMKNLIKEEDISIKGVIGAISGYIYIGLTGGVLFESVSKLHNSPILKHFSEGALSSYAYYYFSFMTITTVGYGDIYPLNSLGQSITVILSLTGQIYLTVVIASFVGKFLSK